MSPGAAPELSVVICTRNRAAALPQALACYAALERDVAWELVIVDNGSTDATPDVLAAFARESAVPVRVLQQPRKGLSRARNTGWRAAAAPTIAFTDDDCYPQPGFLAAIRAAFAAGADYVGGRILLFDPEDHPITIQTRDTPLALPPGTFVPSGLIQGANMAARRGVLDALAGFDEMLGAGTPFSSEDLDFVSRAAAAGFRGAYDPAPVVLHHHRRRGKADVRALSRGYDVGRGAFYMKCLLDPRRRATGAAAWRAQLGGYLREARGNRRVWLRLWDEARGATGYLAARIARRFGGPDA